MLDGWVVSVSVAFLEEGVWGDKNDISLHLFKPKLSKTIPKKLLLGFFFFLLRIFAT